MAIKVGSLETVKSAIKQGVDPNIKDSEGNSLLLSALRSRQFQICQYLLETGANPEIKSNAGVSAIDLAEEFDIENTLKLRRFDHTNSTLFESVQDTSSDWPAEKEIILPPSEAKVTNQASDYQASIAKWDLVDNDALWEDFEFEFPIILSDSKEPNPYYKAIMELSRKADLYGVLDPSEIKITFETMGIQYETECDDIFATTEFILGSIGFVIEDCSKDGYTWEQEQYSYEASELDLADFSDSIYFKKTTSLNLFQRTLHKSKTISRGEEKELFEKLKLEPSNMKVRDKLLMANLRFAYKIATGYGKNCAAIGLEDRISEAMYGLIIALDRFEIERELKFISYAVFWIRQRIQKLYIDHERNVRLPPNKINLANQFKRTLLKNNDDYLQTLDDPQFKESAKEIPELLEMMSETSLDSPFSVPYDDETTTLLDRVGIEPCQEDEVDTIQLRFFLDKILDGLLTEREAKVLRMYFGIGYSKEFTFDEIGRELNLTRERIRQIRNKSLYKLLKNRNSSEILYPFYAEGVEN